MPGGDVRSLNVGDIVNLVNATTITGSVSTTNNTLVGYEGALLRYDLQVSATTTDLQVTVLSAGLDESAKALSEGFFGSIGLLIDTFDFVTSTGIDSAVEAVRHSGTVGSGTQYAAFGAASYGKVRYDTGSHVDVSGFSGIIGISGLVERESFTLTLGAFFEAGNGDYDTYNSFPNSGEVLGNGDVNYGGAGIMARFDFAKSQRGNFHLEVAGRMGTVKNTFESGYFNGGWGNFETKGNYYSLHLGFGYLFNVDDKYLIDLYGKYFWTLQEGDDVRLPGGDRVTFDDVNSHRLRGGLRFILNSPEKVKPYVGVAYEHELDGKVKASAYGIGIPEPDSSGGSFVGELGVLIAPTENVIINIGAQGYAGQRRGVTGTLGLKILF
jgi:hypothetical protein